MVSPLSIIALVISYSIATNTMKMKGNVQTILGTMTFGGQTNKDDAIQQLKLFVSRGYNEIDTARMYCRGKTEEMLGEVLRVPAIESDKVLESIRISSKVNPFKGYNDNLSPENILKQSKEILSALGRPSTEILYLHAPDITVPIEDTLQAMQSLYLLGKFKYLGLSNYAAWEVVYIWSYCKSQGWVLPTIYQGMYNAITRDVERELFPALKKCNMSFYAYNPLCGGLLTGKHFQKESVNSQGTRFDVSNSMYRNRYWKDEYFQAISMIRDVTNRYNIKMPDASIRWLRHHSKLSDTGGDGVIIGASTVEHLTSNLNSCEAGPLPEEVVEVFGHAWRITAPVCDKYFRP